MSKPWRAVSVSFLMGTVTLFCVNSTAALDCSAAQDSIDKVICSNDTLKKKDEALFQFYFDTLQKTDARERPLLLAEQRAWLKARQTRCEKETNEELTSCIAMDIEDRLQQLRQQWGSFDRYDPLHYGPDHNSDHLSGFANKGRLYVGAETALIKPIYIDGVRYALTHDGKTLDMDTVDASNSFWIVDHWHGTEVTAQLIRAENGGAADCYSLYVLETRHEGELKAIRLLHDGCDVEFDPPNVAKTATGFTVKRPATPTHDGTTISWNAATGDVTKEKILFRPDAGTRMLDLVNLAPEGSPEPLRNAEFYRALAFLPDKDRVRVARALWHVVDKEAYRFYASIGKDTGGEEDEIDHGRFESHDFIVYAGCGAWLDAPRYRCDDDDALAIWRKSSGQFFWAVGPNLSKSQDVGGGDVHFYPSLKEWPNAVAKLVKAWQQQELRSRFKK